MYIYHSQKQLIFFHVQHAKLGFCQIYKLFVPKYSPLPQKVSIAQFLRQFSISTLNREVFWTL